MTAQPASGILNVDKPWGWTSHDVVGLVRHLVGQRQVGHAGTLDPRATGVLLVMVGAATRLSEYLMHSRKCYLARVRLGVTTTTEDSEGEVIARGPATGITRDEVVAALSSFRGAVQQVPPAYAAIKQGGVPAYKRARRGESPRMAAREVQIDALALVAMQGDVLDILIWCSAGTYIRSLARDLGESLGCGAHLAALRRLSSGTFGIDTASGVQALRRLAAAGRLHESFWPTDETVASMPALVLDDTTAAAAAHGNLIASRQADTHLTPAVPAADGTDARLYASDGRFLALARYAARLHAWQPRKVLV